MSTTRDNYGADRAVDGMVGQDPDTCNCCATTENSALSWWEVDLKRVFPISEIIIQGRLDGMIGFRVCQCWYLFKGLHLVCSLYRLNVLFFVSSFFEVYMNDKLLYF